MPDSGAVESTQGWETVGLYGEGGPQWRGVSPRLATARSVVATAVCVPLAALLAVIGIVADWRPLLWAAAGLVAVWLWMLWLVRRQVSSISFAEQGEELVIRRGRLWRSLVSIPYGRLQLADMQSGPVARHFGLASVEIHTAAARSGGSIPGLPLAEAEALRTRLTERGESQRAGL
jgi:membrane protein YdbS with pleckstrin-like domain